VVFFASFSIRQYSSGLLNLFYPDNGFLYLSLGIAVPAFFAALILSFRERVWKWQKTWVFLFIKPLILFSTLADLGFHIYLAQHNYWQFSWVIAITLLTDFLCLYFLLQDKHIQLMLKDWRLVPPSEEVTNVT
jgi:hypothetical protein